MRYIYLFFSQLFVATSLFADSSVIFLCYHTFHDTSKSPYNISSDILREQLHIISELGYRFVSFDEIEAGTVDGNNNICITIDDGSVTVEKAYREVFAPFGVKPLLFIYPARIGKEMRALSDMQLQSLVSEGLHIGGHGFHHLKIDNKLFTDNPTAFTKEITRGKTFLEEKIGHPVTLFAYPFGIVCKESVELLKRSGYSFAFTISYGDVKIPLSENKNPYRLPRYMVTRESWPYILSVLQKRRLLFQNDNAKK